MSRKRTFWEDANHVGQAEGGQLKRALVAAAKHIEGSLPLKYWLGAPIANVPSQYLQCPCMVCLRALSSVACNQHLAWSGMTALTTQVFWHREAILLRSCIAPSQ